MNDLIKALQERLETLEHHIEEHHKQAAHERKTMLQHVRAERRDLTKLARTLGVNAPTEDPEFFVAQRRKPKVRR